MKTEVINIKLKRNVWRKRSKEYVYIGRPTVFGNLFTHLKFLRKTGELLEAPSQEDAVRFFEDWLYGLRYTSIQQQKRKAILREMPSLVGKFLGCYCDPQPCHGHVYRKMLRIGYEIEIDGAWFVWRPQQQQALYAMGGSE